MDAMFQPLPASPMENPARAWTLQRVCFPSKPGGMCALVGLLALLLAAGCSDGEVIPEGTGGSGGHTSGQPCFETEGADFTATLGEANALEEFEPFDEGQVVELIFGSQAGMGLGTMLELENLDLASVRDIEVTLLVDGSPLGTFSQDEPTLSCSDGRSLVDAMVMIDVVGHPTVTSVAQLDGRSAVLDYAVFGGDGVLAEGLVGVELSL